MCCVNSHLWQGCWITQPRAVLLPSLYVKSIVFLINFDESRDSGCFPLMCVANYVINSFGNTAFHSYLWRITIDGEEVHGAEWRNIAASHYTPQRHGWHACHTADKLDKTGVDIRAHMGTAKF